MPPYFPVGAALPPFNGEEDAEGLLAHCIQHEVDHLNGIIFVDHLSALKRKLVRRKMEKIRRETL